MTTNARSPLARLIRPQSIAVFGGKEAARVVEQCGKAGYRGQICPCIQRATPSMATAAIARSPIFPARRMPPSSASIARSRSRFCASSPSAAPVAPSATPRALRKPLQNCPTARPCRRNWSRQPAAWRCSAPIATASSTCSMTRCSGPTSTAWSMLTGCGHPHPVLQHRAQHFDAGPRPADRLSDDGRNQPRRGFRHWLRRRWKTSG